MNAFVDYAKYYNLIYQDKAYGPEVDFILSRLKSVGTVPTSLLDLGCGTGRHATEFAGREIRVNGVDISSNMIGIGKAELEKRPIARGVPTLSVGDARTVRLGQRFDVVTSLFHVMSYQTSSEDAKAVLVTAREHLVEDGVFFFDFWHGPGVLASPPERRVKVVEDSAVRIVRRATPKCDEDKHAIEVVYDIEYTEKGVGLPQTFSEQHFLRYWYSAELAALAEEVGFSVVGHGAWLEDHDVPLSWYAWLMLKRRPD